MNFNNLFNRVEKPPVNETESLLEKVPKKAAEALRGIFGEDEKFIKRVDEKI